MGFFRGFSIAMGANAVLFVLSFCINKLLYVYLGLEDNGVYFLIMRFALFFNLLLGEWLRLTAINIAGQDRTLNPVLTANALFYCMTTGLIAATLALVSPEVLSPIFPHVPLEFVWAVVVVGAFLTLRNVFQSLLLVNNHMVSYGAVFVLWGALMLVLDFVFLVLLRLGLWSAVMALVIATAIAALWGMAASFRLNGFSWKPSLEVFGMSWRLGLRASWAVLGMFFLLNVHALAIDWLAGTATVALFSVCFRIFQLYQRVSDVTSTVLYPAIARNEERKGFTMTMRVSRNLLFFTFVTALIGGVLGKFIILVVSDTAYLGAYIPLLLMLPGIVFINAGSIINSSYWGRGYPSKIIHAPFFASALGIGLDCILMPSMGLNGAAVSFSVTGCLWFSYVIVIFRRDTGYTLRDILLPARDDIILLTARMKQALMRGKD